MKDWNIKAEKVIIHAPEGGLLRMTEVIWRQGPCVEVDAISSPTRIYVSRGGRRREVTNLLRLMAARRAK